MKLGYIICISYFLSSYVSNQLFFLGGEGDYSCIVLYRVFGVPTQQDKNCIMYIFMTLVALRMHISHPKG